MDELEVLEQVESAESVVQKRKRGRPKLSEEEKLRRKEERMATKSEKNTPNIPAAKGMSETKQRRVRQPVDHKPVQIDIDENPEEDIDDDLTYANTEYKRKYTFVLEEDVRHALGFKCGRERVSTNYVLNELIKKWIAGEIVLDISISESDKWLTDHTKYVPIPRDISKRDNISP